MRNTLTQHPECVETFLGLDEIQKSDAYRCREQENEEAIERYTERFKDFKDAVERDENPAYPFPSVWVRQEGTTYTLIGGYLRLEAARRTEMKEILVKVFTGSEDDAFVIALRDNGEHGVRLSNGDLKFVIRKALERFPDKTPGAIALMVGCSRSYAARIELELSTSGQLPRPEQREGADGRVRSARRAVKQPGGITLENNGSTVSENQSDDTAPAIDTGEQPSPDLIQQVDKFIEFLESHVAAEFPEEENHPYIYERMREWATGKAKA